MEQTTGRKQSLSLMNRVDSKVVKRQFYSTLIRCDVIVKVLRTINKLLHDVGHSSHPPHEAEEPSTSVIKEKCAVSFTY